MATISLDSAAITLTELLARVEAGEEVVLERGGHPIAKLVPCQPSPSKRQFGAMRGVLSVGPAFFEPLPDVGLWE